MEWDQANQMRCNLIFQNKMQTIFFFCSVNQKSNDMLKNDVITMYKTVMMQSLQCSMIDMLKTALKCIRMNSIVNPMNLKLNNVSNN